eukprot:TRINITY_DN877_c0_g1_i1.p1 TRINITY_DN877_c0_g1~~TRINITY_DN877_c0_g1_i1.p1  ORF type:complete len:359 (-),score=62.80 TRINITY_DN877_c0_g1_i1:493-1569(-)
MESPPSSCSPPSTPQPQHEQSSVHPIGLPSVLASSPRVSDPAPPTTLIGSLDLKPCSLEEFLDIDTSVYGTYEYVEGILVALPMSEEPHDNIVKYLHNHATVRYVRGEIKYPPATQEGVAIPNAPSSSDNSPRRRTIRRPDLAIAAPLSQSERNQLSPKSKRISHPKKGKIKTGVEVTSTNEKTDTEVKPLEYDETGMLVYAAVVRDANCKDESKRDQRVEVRRRNSATDSWSAKEVYRGDTPADMGDFGIHKPSSLFSHPDPTKPLNQLAEQITESEKEKEELRRKVEAAEKREEESKKEKEELRRNLEAAVGKKRHYKNLVRTKIPEEDVSNSSSSRGSKTNSPESKRGRRNRSRP